MKSIKVILFVFVLVCANFIFATSDKNAKIVAVVNDQIVTEQDLNVAIVLMSILSNNNIDFSDASKKVALNRVIDDMLLKNRFTSLMPQSDKDINISGFLSYLENMYKLSSGTLEKRINDNNISRQDLINYLKNEILRQKFVSMLSKDVVSSVEGDIIDALAFDASADFDMVIYKIYSVQKTTKMYNKLIAFRKSFASNVHDCHRKGNIFIKKMEIKYSSLDSKLKNLLRGVSESNFSSIIDTKNGFESFYVLKKTPSNIPKDIKDIFANNLLNKKVIENYQKVIVNIRENTYIKIFI